MKEIRKILKDKITTKIKNIDDRLNEVLTGSYEKLFKRSLTIIGSLIREIRSECYCESGELDETEYIKRLSKFYCDEFEEKCLSSRWIYTKELLLRRKELKNQSNFLATVTISIVTGVVAGLLANNIYKWRLLVQNISWSIKISRSRIFTITWISAII